MLHGIAKPAAPLSRQEQRRRVGGSIRQRGAGRWIALAVGLPILSYAATTALAWSRYGRLTRRKPADDDALLDRFMPAYEVAERHQVRVAAPPHITLAAASEIDLQQSLIVRGIFIVRAFVLGAEPQANRPPTGLLAEVKSLGWRVLAEDPGREIVLGAVTQPWHGNVVFRGLEPAAFSTFAEAGYVKIAWNLRADPIGSGHSIFRTETRVTTTDPTARMRFRWYWARFSPGIVLIRRLMIRLLKTEAERRAKEA
jgi:hypothetical protein